MDHSLSCSLTLALSRSNAQGPRTHCLSLARLIHFILARAPSLVRPSRSRFLVVVFSIGGSLAHSSLAYSTSRRMPISHNKPLYCQYSIEPSPITSVAETLGRAASGGPGAAICLGRAARRWSRRAALAFSQRLYEHRNHTESPPKTIFFHIFWAEPQVLLNKN